MADQSRIVIRALRIAAALAVALLVAVAAAQVTNTGRVFTVRSYVRFERLWARDFPVVAARGWVRHWDPSLTSIGLLRPVRVEVQPGVSLRLDPVDDIGRTVLVSRTGQWEPEVWSAIRGHLSVGAVFLDVGAHIGIDSLAAATVVGKAGRVIAFEPNPTTIAELRENIRASAATNVAVQPFALTDTEQNLTLFDSRAGGNSGSSSLSARNAGDQGRPYVVRGRRLDDVVRELGLERVDLIKADIEGAELLMLRGATDTLARFRPPLILEIVPQQLENMGASVAGLETMLQSFGYGEGHWVDYKNKEYLFVARESALQRYGSIATVW